MVLPPQTGAVSKPEGHTQGSVPNSDLSIILPVRERQQEHFTLTDRTVWIKSSYPNKVSVSTCQTSDKVPDRLRKRIGKA